jgi:putative FmdB family regulatory protein
MPIYEYCCEHCGNELEAWQKITERPKKVCPVCGKHKLVRLISQTSFRLKGTGWYVTDYASGNNPSAKKQDTEKEPRSTAKSETPKSSKKSSKKED